MEAAASERSRDAGAAHDNRGSARLSGCIAASQQRESTRVSRRAPSRLDASLATHASAGLSPSLGESCRPKSSRQTASPASERGDTSVQLLVVGLSRSPPPLFDADYQDGRPTRRAPKMCAPGGRHLPAGHLDKSPTTRSEGEQCGRSPGGAISRVAGRRASFSVSSGRRGEEDRAYETFSLLVAASCRRCCLCRWQADEASPPRRWLNPGSRCWPPAHWRHLAAQHGRRSSSVDRQRRACRRAF